MAEPIQFIDTLYTDQQFRPVPAYKFLPEWYKNTEPYINGAKKPSAEAKTQATIKRCVPVLDSLSLGYFILSPCDVYVSKRDGLPYYQWSWSPLQPLITFHSITQALEHPYRNKDYAIPKWTNPWLVKTPKGYSCIFTTPFHRDSPFQIFTGVVDTDAYDQAVNFPFGLKDPEFEGLIPAGTPIAQVIPFKRTSWKSEYIETTPEVTARVNRGTTELNSRWYDVYRNRWWSKKEFK
jgi:hypothetical protein